MTKYYIRSLSPTQGKANGHKEKPTQQNNKLSCIHAQRNFKFRYSNNPTMDPVKTCIQVLQHIRQTGLNFVFSESPFGVNISIKKSFRKNTSHDTTPPAHSAVQVDVEENSDNKVNVAKEEAIILIKDLKSTIKSLEEENKDIINSLEEYRLSDKKL